MTTFEVSLNDMWFQVLISNKLSLAVVHLILCRPVSNLEALPRYRPMSLKQCNSDSSWKHQNRRSFITYSGLSSIEDAITVSILEKKAFCMTRDYLMDFNIHWKKSLRQDSFRHFWMRCQILGDTMKTIPIWIVTAPWISRRWCWQVQYLTVEILK